MELPLRPMTPEEKKQIDALYSKLVKSEREVSEVSVQEPPLILGSDKASFLVAGTDLGKQDSEFINFLKSEGFRCKYGFGDCPWAWVNIEHKTYGRGRPGVKYANAIGGHAITVEEFMMIYKIFKKYEGLKELENVSSVSEENK